MSSPPFKQIKCYSQVTLIFIQGLCFLLRLCCRRQMSTGRKHPFEVKKISRRTEGSYSPSLNRFSRNQGSIYLNIYSFLGSSFEVYIIKQSLHYKIKFMNELCLLQNLYSFNNGRNISCMILFFSLFHFFIISFYSAILVFSSRI